jgi:hypothetical protein
LKREIKWIYLTIYLERKDSKINTAIKKEREDNIDDLHPVKLESSAEVKK